MTPTNTERVREEERVALEQHRRLKRARRKAQEGRERDYRARLRTALSETRTTHPRCHCEFSGVQDRAGLVALGGGCTDPNHVCPRLDAVRRRMGVWS